MVPTLQRNQSHNEEKPHKVEEAKRSGGLLGKLRRKDKDKTPANNRLYSSKSASNLLV